MIALPAATAVLPALGAGLFAAGHAASWGAYKDSPFEGFKWRSYARSFGLAAVVAALLALWLPMTTAPGAVVLVGAVYGVERLLTEWWKSIVRHDDQSAYAIPMRLGLFGRPVDRPSVRYLVGALVAAAVVAGLVAVHVAQVLLTPLPGLVGALVVIAVGSAGGWATAVGGAWKDAPIEGFSPWKFLRSPAVAAAWAVPLSALTSSWPALLLAAAGFAVVSIETYKTFFTRGRPPGKFAGRPVRAALPRVRRVLAVQNAAWWLALAALLGVATTTLVAGAPLTALVGSAAVAALLVAPTVGRLGVLQAALTAPPVGP